MSEINEFDFFPNHNNSIGIAKYYGNLVPSAISNLLMILIARKREGFKHPDFGGLNFHFQKLYMSITSVLTYLMSHM